MFIIIIAIAFRIISGRPAKKFTVGILPVVFDAALAYAVLDHYWGLGWF